MQRIAYVISDNRLHGHADRVQTPAQMGLLPDT